MDSLRIEVTRGDLVESVHQVSAAVVRLDGRLVASAGDSTLVTMWRSAAKPFQALPLLEDGVVDRYRLTDEDLAISCASHSSEPIHLAAVAAFQARVGIGEDALACGPHPPLSARVARDVVREGTTLTPNWSNCSGKHTGLLALAKHHGWPLDQYEVGGHPVQQRVLASVLRFTGLARHEIGLTVDGCATVCFGLPLQAMALAYARFGARRDAATAALWNAITAHPRLIAGSGRFETVLMEAWPGEVLAKVGAEGIYNAAIPSLDLGIAIKVEDGASRAAPMAMFAVVRSLLDRFGGPLHVRERLAGMTDYIEPVHRNTRDAAVGVMRAAGSARFLD